MTYPAGNLFISVSHGRLEGILKECEPKQSRGAALVLHPHPLHGGTMHNKVVYRIGRVLNEKGFTTLRINFRGVGLSTGEHDNARGEKDDALAALDYLSGRYPGQDLLLAGFSFGARVALETGIGDSRVQSLLACGTPLNMYDFSFLVNCRKPILFVQGERDEFGDVERLRRVVSELPPEANAKIEIIPGAGHFFEGMLDRMAISIANWLAP